MSGHQFRVPQRTALHEPQPRGTTPLGQAFSVTWSNDNFIVPFSAIPKEHRAPGSYLGDDDGATNEVRLEHQSAWENEDGSIGDASLRARHQILTEDQHWTSYLDRGHGSRIDVAEVGIEGHHTERIGEGLQQTVGLGGGLQALGNLGGRDIQENFHLLMRNGMTGGYLQGNNVPGESVHPFLSGGVERRLDLAAGFEAFGGAQGKLPLGPGIGWAELYGGLQGEWETGIGIDPYVGVSGRLGASAAAPYADINNTLNRPYAGGRIEAGVEIGDLVRLGYGIEYGGAFDDPQGVISIGGPNLLPHDIDTNR